MIGRLFLTALTLLFLTSCGESYQESKRNSRLLREKLEREDSAALKIGVTPTLDCLPLYVAEDYGLFGSLGQDIRLKRYGSMLDCDTAIYNNKVEATISDLVRVEHLNRIGADLECKIATNAYWQLILNRQKKLRKLKQIGGNMVAITRFSATDLLADYATDSTKTDRDYVYKVQINDVGIRLLMLLNNEIDIIIATEPHATAARLAGNEVALDSRNLDLKLGTIAFRNDILADSSRQKQVEAFVSAYDMACDSINKYGTAHYNRLIAKECGVSDSVANALASDIKFLKSAKPRQRDFEAASRWTDETESRALKPEPIIGQEDKEKKE